MKLSRFVLQLSNQLLLHKLQTKQDVYFKNNEFMR